jgi:hypothetical protein
MKRFAGRFLKFDRSEPAAFQHLTEIVEHRNEVAHRSVDVWLEVAVSDYALFRIEIDIEIDQNEGPLGERRNARYDWSLELEHDRACANALQRQSFEPHSAPLRQSEHDDGMLSRPNFVDPVLVLPGFEPAALSDTRVHHLKITEFHF